MTGAARRIAAVIVSLAMAGEALRGAEVALVANAATAPATRPVRAADAAKPATPAATIYLVDDSSINGEIVSFDGRKLVVEAAGKARTIALEDVSRIVLLPPRVVTSGAAPQAQSPVRRRGLRALLGAVGVPVSDAETPEDKPADVPEAGARPTTSPSFWYLRLAGGDYLHGTLGSWAGQRLVVKLAGGPDVSVGISAQDVIEMWRGTPEQVAAAKAQHGAASGDLDTAYVLEDKDQIVAVAGRANGIGGDALQFRFNDSDRKIAMGKLLGVVFASSGRTPAADAFHQAAVLSSGDMLSGTWTGLDRDFVTFRLGDGGVARLPRSGVNAIECRNGRLVYLSDLAPVGVEQTPYFDRLIPYRTDAALDGGAIRLSDGVHAKGVAVHSRCVLTYELGGEFERFRAKVGFEQPGGRIGRAAIRVVADGRVLLDNPDARGEEPAIDLDADVRGVRRLVLEVDFGQGQDAGGRVDWADARLLRARVGGATTSPTTAP